MLHFTNTALSGHASVWGTRLIEGSENDWQSKLYELDALIARPLPGQHTGGIGIYRTTTGQPIEALFNGAYTLDTYLTTYSYVNGQYSLAIEVHVTLTEALNLADTVTTNTNYSVSLADGLGLNDAYTAIRLVAVSLSESLNLADTIAVNGIYGVILPESLIMQDGASTTGGTSSLVAYVVNANTGAVSTYTNYEFNSFAKLGGKFYGMNDAGLHELTGTDDMGTAIDASIVLGTSDLSTDGAPAAFMKRCPVAYIGANSDGDLMLRVTANGETNDYTLTTVTGTSLKTGRLMLGKGVASRYWDFELTNVSGSDFTVESIALFPVLLNRRIVEG